MIIYFAISDKGGTGRSVTSSNLAYRCALRGHDVCYFDFDFGSPTSGSIFGVRALRGTAGGGLHAYFTEERDDPHQIDVWSESDRFGAGLRPTNSGRLVLYPGDEGGGEFEDRKDVVERCSQLFGRAAEEFDIAIVDLSAGRSFAANIALKASARLRAEREMCRWLVFHRWTRQHIIAASGLVFGQKGLVELATKNGYEPADLSSSLRFIRTAVIDVRAATTSEIPASRATWLEQCNKDLRDLAREHGLGNTATLGEVPLDPVLQWREQLITDQDSKLQIANPETVDAYKELAEKLVAEDAWESL